MNSQALSLPPTGVAEGRPLRLLSFDSGGGIRSLSQLLVLENIMKEMKTNFDLRETPKPCDYFDLIGGSGAGGILAVLVGRLRMSCTDAIEAWKTLGGDVYSFPNKKHYGQSAFGGIAVRQKTYELLSRLDMGQNMWEEEHDHPTGKSFVCAFLEGDGEPVRIRSYMNSEAKSGLHCSLEDVARIAAADVPFLGSTKIRLPSRVVEFLGVDGWHRNPVNTVIQEAAVIFGANRPVGCIVSVGAGHPGTRGDEQPKIV